LPTKYLLMQAGYNERDLKHGIDYMKSQKPSQKLGMNNPKNKYQSNNGDINGHVSFTKKDMVLECANVGLILWVIECTHDEKSKIWKRI